MNRRQKSPLRLRPKKIEVDVNRIINHAAKLVMEYNQIEIDKIMQSEKVNQEKIKELLRLSSTKLPRLRSKNKKHKYYESNKSTKRKIIQIEDESVIVENKKNNSVYSSLNEKSHSPLLTNLSCKKDSECNKSCVLIEESLEKKSFSLKLQSQNSENSHRSSILSKKDSQLLSNRTLDEILTFTSISSVEDKDIDANVNEEESNKANNKFLYEIEIINGENKNTSSSIDIFVVINGKFSKSNKFFLRQYYMSKFADAIPFLAENTDKFIIYSPIYFGIIDSIIVGIDLSKGESWYLEYISILDHATSEQYRFTCRRWLGIKGKDKCSEVKLGYTPPYKKSIVTNISSLSKSELSNKEDIIQYDLSLHSSIENKIKEKTVRLDKSNSSQNIQNASTEKSTSDSQYSDSSKIEPQTFKSMPIDDIKIIQSNNSIIFENSIHSAIKNYDYEKVKKMCSVYESVECSQDSDGNMPLHIAAIYYEDNNISREIINLLLSLDIDINRKSMKGYTPFLLAVLNGNLGSVKYFKDVLKVDFSIMDTNNNTALHLAVLNGHTEIVKYILNIPEFGNISMKNSFGETALDIAEKNKDIKCMQIFNEIKEHNLKYKNYFDGAELTMNASCSDGVKNITQQTNEIQLDSPLTTHCNTQEINNSEIKTSDNDPFNNDKEKTLLDIYQDQLEQPLNKSVDTDESNNIHSLNKHPIEESFERYESIDNFEKSNENKIPSIVEFDSRTVPEPEFEIECDIFSLNNEDDNQGIMFTKSFPSKRKESKLNILNLRKVQFDDTSTTLSASSNRESSPISLVSSSFLSPNTSSLSSLKENIISQEMNNNTIDNEERQSGSRIRNTNEIVAYFSEEHQKNSENIRNSNSSLIHHFEEKSISDNGNKDNIKDIEDHANEMENRSVLFSHSINRNNTDQETKLDTKLSNDKAIYNSNEINYYSEDTQQN